jgi:cob(I)alamin adenosyltransferase
MTQPRTAKDALLVELLGDADKIIARAESLPHLLDDCENRLKFIANVVNDASDRYESTITKFNNQAKQNLTEFVESRSSAYLSGALDHQKSMIEGLTASLANINNRPAPSHMPVWLLVSIAAIVAAMVSTVICLLFIKA